MKPGSSARSLFPIFSAPGTNPGAKRLAYLDSAASAQKPQSVIEALSRHMATGYANIHRGAYHLSADSSVRYEDTREHVARYIGAASSKSIVFTRGATEAVNLVAHGLERLLPSNGVILITRLEHHSNIVPWQLLAARKGLTVEFVRLLPNGTLDLEDFDKKIAELRPNLVACTQLANSLGTLVPIETVITKARQAGALVLIDGAQGVCHLPINVTSMDPDFYVFSGHKLYGPNGVGILYARTSLLEAMDPFLGGGDMISTVSVKGSTWADIPQKFEAGTPAISEVIAFDAALSFLEEFSWPEREEHERSLLTYASKRLSEEPDVTLHGPGAESGSQRSIISFSLRGVHPHDLATIADANGVCIRAGQHCAMPALEALGLESTARMSLGIYSTEEDIDQLCAAIGQARGMFSKKVRSGIREVLG